MLEVLKKSTLCPLGCRVNDTGDDCRDYVLYHPAGPLPVPKIAHVGLKNAPIGG